MQAAHENEGDNTLPDSGADISVLTEQWLEFHWALDPANASAGSVYTFQVINITDSNTALANAIASDVTIETGEISSVGVFKNTIG